MKLISRLLNLLGAPEVPVGNRPQQPVISARDRRVAPRFSVGAPAFLLVDNRRVAASIVDISLSGIQLFLRFNPPYDETLRIELELGDRCICLSAKIMRHRFDGGLYRIGAHFLDVTPQQQHDLSAFIEMHVPHRRSIA